MSPGPRETPRPPDWFEAEQARVMERHQALWAKMGRDLEKERVMDYWEECISEALDDAGITATAEQIDNITGWVEGAHENYGMAHGHDCIPNPLKDENMQLKKELVREREKTICPDCHGSRVTVTQGPCHSAESSCFTCRGTGYIY